MLILKNQPNTIFDAQPDSIHINIYLAWIYQSPELLAHPLSLLFILWLRAFLFFIILDCLKSLSGIWSIINQQKKSRRMTSPHPTSASISPEWNKRRPIEYPWRKKGEKRSYISLQRNAFRPKWYKINLLWFSFRAILGLLVLMLLKKSYF